MINPVSTRVSQPSGEFRNIIIEPMLVNTAEQGLNSNGIYKLYKDALGDETTLFTESMASATEQSNLPDEANPDYLGKIRFDNNQKWTFEGDLLSINEQQQLVQFILSY